MNRLTLRIKQILNVRFLR